MLRPIAAFVCGALLAQEPVPLTRFVPADAQIVARIQAPVRWAEAFGPTHVGRLLEAPTLAKLVENLRLGFESNLETDPWSAAMTPAVIRGFFGDWRGELLVALRFDEAGLLAGGDADPDFAAMITFVPGGDYDLGELLAGFRRGDELAPFELEALQVGDMTFHAGPGAIRTTQVEFVDDHLVMFVGNAIERFGPAMLAGTGRATELPSDAPLALRCDLTWIGRTLVEIVQERFDEVAPDAPIDLAEIFEHYGLFAMRSLDLAVEAAEQDLSVSMTLRTTEDCGLLGVLMTEQGPPALARAVPPDTLAFRVGAFDLTAIYRVFAALAERDGESGADAMQQFEAGFAESTGVRLREDLLDHLGTELLTLGGLADLFATMAEYEADGERADPDAVLAGSCYGLALRDGKALATTIDTMLRKFGLRAARKTETYGDHEIHALRVGGVLTVEYAVTDDLLLLVIGSRGRGNEYLRLVLDTKSRGDGGLPAAVAARLDDVTTGWSGVGRMPLADAIRSLATVTEARDRSGNRANANNVELLRGVARDLEAIGYAEVLGITYTTKTMLRTVLRW